MKAFLAAVAIGFASLATAFGSAAVLRHRTLRDSRQQSTPDRWREPTAVSSPELVARGRVLFLDSCAHCHGADARGDEGPDLHQVQVSDRYIARIVTKGIPGEMPAFAKKHGASDIAALTAYLRSLR